MIPHSPCPLPPLRMAHELSGDKNVNWRVPRKLKAALLVEDQGGWSRGVAQC